MTPPKDEIAALTLLSAATAAQWLGQRPGADNDAGA
jgi:hypothetical protein